MADEGSRAVHTLFAGAASRVWGGPLAAGGRLTLTTDALRFEPTGAFSSLFREQAFSVPLSRLLRAEWRSLRSRLALQRVDGDDIIMEGALITRLAVCLRAMGLAVDEEHSRPEHLGDLHRVETASVVAGLLRSPGWVALGQRGVFFESKGLVEHIAGVRGRGVELAEVAAVRVDGSAVVIESGAEPVAIEVTSPSGWLAAIAAEAARVPLPAAAEAPPADPAGGPVLADGTGVLQGVDSGQATRGWYHLQADAGLLFYGLDGARVATVPLSDVQRAVYGRLSADEPDVLRIGRPGAETLLLRPCEGLAALQVVRAHALALPLVDAASMGDLGALRALQGEVTFARITTNHRDDVSFRAGWMVQAPDSIGLVMRHGLDWRHPRGTRVRLTVGVDRGVYEIDGRLLRIEQVDPAELGAWRGDSAPQTVLFVAVPHADEVRFERSRRKDFRVPTSDPAPVRSLRWVPGGGRKPWGRGHDGRLFDLSASGCAVLLKHEQGVGRFFEVEVEVGGVQRMLAAEVVHSARHTEDDLDWFRHGMRFVGLDEQAHAALAREVRRRETRARYHAELAELEGAGEGAGEGAEEAVAEADRGRRPMLAGSQAG